eukprot:TRINITY_DN1759_c0_g1_i4.p1 TRINITY_DN1759_c0_g1~~TRINITY_DN1759_c0_g1_i4.p1  ORF type:complete len:391 (+),score=87.21 TRINITY_DN1759_c0_g1_i4:223-1395(+)
MLNDAEKPCPVGTPSGGIAYECMAREQPSFSESPVLPPVEPDEAGAHACWICLDKIDVDTIPEQALRPCTCAVYVHRECLNSWRFGTYSSSAERQCPNCKQDYQFQTTLRHGGGSKAGCCKVTGKTLRILAGVWIPPLLLLALVTSLFAPLVFLMDSPRNIPVAMRFIKGHVLDLDETNEMNTTTYIDYLQDRYQSEPSLTWDQYFLFAAMLMSPFIMILVHKTMKTERELQHAEEMGLTRSRSTTGRGSSSSTCCNGCNCYCDSSDWFFWYWMWHPSHRGQYGGYSHNSSSDCDCCGGDCDCCDCKCGGGGGGGGDSGEALVIVCVVLIALLALIVLTSWIYLMVTTIIQSARLAKRYYEKAQDQALFENGTKEVLHLGGRPVPSAAMV